MIPQQVSNTGKLITMNKEEDEVFIIFPALVFTGGNSSHSPWADDSEGGDPAMLLSLKTEIKFHKPMDPDES